MKKKQSYGRPTIEEGLIKLQRYCAYQDRCHKEVRDKLRDLGFYGDDLGQIVVALIEEKFLDEERFVISYVRGKYRYKKWGRNKIKQGLRQKDISPYCLKIGMKEIDEAEYLENLQTLLIKKNERTKAKSLFERKAKLATFVIGKGYESFLVWQTINQLLDKESKT